MSIDGDVVLIGSFYDDDMGSHSGSAYVYRRSAGVWSEEAKLIASDGVEGDALGISVSISGNVAVAGAPFVDTFTTKPGAAYVYRWNGSSWSQEAKLTPSDGAVGDRFGHSVSVNGNIIVVGAPLADVGGPDSGAAYVFRWNGSAWVEEGKLTASDSASDDSFGYSASISGNAAVVGALFAGQQDRGQAYVYRWNESAWSQEALLVASNATAGALFGHSVNISGDRIISGASKGDGVRKLSGAAYVFDLIGSTWTEQIKLRASDGKREDYFGESVAVSGNVAVVGAPRDDDGGQFSGSAYIYELTSS